MSQETPWFENKRVELTDMHRGDREKLRPWVGFGLILAAGMLLSLLGCAAPAKEEGAWHRVCYERPLGQTEEGVLVVQHSCVTIDAFKAAQR